MEATENIYETGEDKILKLYKKEFPQEAIHDEFLNSKFVLFAGYLYTATL
ncbi:hypothetical protein [Fontibacillus sp. BL9]